jgi:hypothetical protein
MLFMNGMKLTMTIRILGINFEFLIGKWVD